MTIVQIINVIAMFDGGVSTICAVNVVVVGVALAGGHCVSFGWLMINRCYSFFWRLASTFLTLSLARSCLSRDK